MADGDNISSRPKIDDGGHAFPFPGTSIARDAEVISTPEFGMTLRDYFAATSRIDYGSDPHPPYFAKATGVDAPTARDDWQAWEQFWSDVDAKLRYMRADAMLKVRAQ